MTLIFSIDITGRTFFPDGKIIYLYCEIYFICGEPIFKDEPMYNLGRRKQYVDKY
jgi:hypothetical protein